jgi:uncharacterized oxidoreductase
MIIAATITYSKENVMWVEQNRLQGRKVLLTGATGKVGTELTALLLQLGCQILAVGRDGEKLNALVDKAGGRVHAIQADLRAGEDITKLADWVEKQHSDCSVLINKHGVMQRSLLTDAPCDRYAEFSEEITTNMTSQIAICAEVFPILARHPQPVVVNVTSGFAISPLPEVAVHSAAKAGLRSFTKSLRYQAEDAGLNMQVTEVLMTLVENEALPAQSQDQLSPHQAAQELIEGVSAGLNEVAVGKVKVLQGVSRLSQTLADQIVRTRVM